MENEKEPMPASNPNIVATGNESGEAQAEITEVTANTPPLDADLVIAQVAAAANIGERTPDESAEIAEITSQLKGETIPSSVEIPDTQIDPYEAINADREKEQNTAILEKMYAGAISEEAASELFTRSAGIIQEGLASFPDDFLNKFNKQFEIQTADKLADFPDDLREHSEEFHRYQVLRGSGFTHGEILSLKKEASTGNLDATLMKAIAKEQQHISRLVEASREEIGACDNAVAGIFAEGEQAQRPPISTIFAGQYQSLLHSSSMNGELSALNGSSMYVTGEDVVLMNIEGSNGIDAKSGLSEKQLAIYMHEQTHGNGLRNIVKGERYIPFAQETAELTQSGLMIMGRDKHSEYYSLNEATTEYFARKARARANIGVNETTYDDETRSLGMLIEHLAQENGDTVEDEEKILRTAYTESGGIDRLRLRVDEQIGPMALEICDVVFTDSNNTQKFLELAIKQKQTASVDEELWISESAAKLDPVALKNIYPFIRIGSRVFDEATSTLVWKTSEEIKAMYPDR